MVRTLGALNVDLDHPARRTRPRRSMLYVPGTNPRALDKARTLPADAVIFDVEDAVLPASKDAARAAIVEALHDGGYGERELILRINRPDSAWGASDLAAAARAPGLDAVLLPKVEGPKAVLAADAVLEALGAPKTLGLMVMIETPMAVLEARALAASTPRLTTFLLGTNDLEALTGTRQTASREPMLTAFSLCILAARAYGLGIIAGVYPKVNDPEGLRAASEAEVDLGFDGKSVIHPSQIPVVNQCFRPSESALEDARAVISAYEEARSQGSGVTLLDGRLVEEPHVRIAQRALDLEAAIARLEAEAADAGTRSG